MVSSASSPNTIAKWRAMLATHGNLVVSDNETAFTSADFRGFLSASVIRQVGT